MNKNIKYKFFEILLLFGLVIIYALFFWRYFSMLPNSSDPLEYIQPTTWGTFIGLYPWADRLIIADGIKILAYFFHRPEITGEVYFGAINFLILIIAITWAYLKKNFWTAFLVGFFLITSYPLLRYANYGYPDATVALFSLVAFIFFNKSGTKNIFWTGFFTTLAIFSKITGLAIFLFFIYEIIYQKKYFDLKFFLAGLFSGMVFTLLLTDILFGFSSLKYAFTHINQYISSNTSKRDISESFLGFFRPEILLPAYLAPIVFWRGYKNKLIKQLFYFTLFFIGFFVLLVLLSSHVKLYPHYLYSAYIFSSIGMAIYLGSFFPLRTKNYQLYYALIGLILIICGLKLGVNGSISTVISMFLSAPLWQIVMYLFFLISTMFTMIIIGIKQKKVHVLIFLLIIGFLGSLITSTSAYYIVSRQKSKIQYLYAFAFSYEKIPEKQFTVYLSARDESFPRGINWIYQTCFDNKYDRSSYSANTKEIEDKIFYLNKENISQSTLNYLVTDDKDIAQNYSQNIYSINYQGITVYIAKK